MPGPVLRGGGTAIGLHRAGFDVTHFEWDADACATLRAAFPGDEVHEGDLRQSPWESWAGRVHLLWSSFPCQAWSTAGKRAGALDERNGWPWTVDAIDRSRPTWVLCENVEGLTMHRGTGVPGTSKSGTPCRLPSRRHWGKSLRGWSDPDGSRCTEGEPTEHRMSQTAPAVPHAALVAAGFDIKGLKTWRTYDGGGYQYTLLHLGKPVATVMNDGNGGCNNVHWMSMTWNGNLDVGADATPAQVKKATAQAALSKAASDALDAFVASLPPHHYHGMDLKVNADWVLSELVNIAETRKSLRSKTLFRVDGTEYQIKAVYDAKVAAYIKGKYPTATILNEDPAYAVAA